MKKTSKENIDKIIDLYSKGSSSKELSELFNISPVSIIRILKRENINIKRAKNKIDKKTLQDQIIEEYNKGYLLKDISLNLKCSNNYIKKILKDNNIKLRTKEDTKLIINKKYYGKKYGRLTILELSDNIGVDTAFKCLCDCGKEKFVKKEYLLDGSTKSCGCLNNDKRSERAKAMYSCIIKYKDPIEASARYVWKRGYSEMSFEDFFELSQKKCNYCGAKPSNKYNCAGDDSSEKRKKHGTFVYNGLDRVDNNLNHTKENCVPCCKYCNFAKRERSLDDFITWLKKLKKNFKNI